jgi:hypothetical protein
MFLSSFPSNMSQYSQHLPFFLSFQRIPVQPTCSFLPFLLTYPSAANTFFSLFPSKSQYNQHLPFLVSFHYAPVLLIYSFSPFLRLGPSTANIILSSFFSTMSLYWQHLPVFLHFHQGIQVLPTKIFLFSFLSNMPQYCQLFQTREAGFLRSS